MSKRDEVRACAEKVLGLLGEKEARLIPFFENILEDDETADEPMTILHDLDVLKPFPQEVWDFVIELLEIEISDGNADAMNDLGAMYYDGTGCAQSFEKAVYYYHMAAENGSRQAQENLGYCYYYGRNVPVDYKKAFHYFALGAFDGHLISLYKIGDMYANGYYVEKNEKEAFLIYMRCAETMTQEAAGDAAGPVYLRLGTAFLNGTGTKKDAQRALFFLQKAELYLYEMVRRGDVMYRNSLQTAIIAQQKARQSLFADLSAGN